MLGASRGTIKPIPDSGNYSARISHPQHINIYILSIELVKLMGKSVIDCSVTLAGRLL